MRYFTNNPLERLMMQKPKAAREDSPPDAAKEHFCYGCKRFGQSCVRPCYLCFRRTKICAAMEDFHSLLLRKRTDFISKRRRKPL